MTFRHSDAAPLAAPQPETCSGEEIRAQIDRVLSSSQFQTSRRCQALLRHITEHTLAGDGIQLKERTLGIEVFGRPADYDTNADPVVRGAAAEVRKKLAQYYHDPGHRGEPRIELRPGSYIPEFHAAEAAPAPAPQRSPMRSVLVWAGAVLVLIAPVALLLARWDGSDLHRFWRPMLDAPGNILFCLAQPRTYNFRSDAHQQEMERRIEGMAPEALKSSQELIPLRDLVPMWDRYLAVGDATCLLRLSSVFERRGKSYRVRSEAMTSFSDLRDGPAVLIGAFDNDWTLRLMGNLRYSFYKDFRGLEMVRDRRHPEKTDWKLVGSWPAWNIAHDYAIVSRVLDRQTDRMTVVAAGITHYGTAGAGEFLSDPRYFAEAVSRLPSDWPTKNLQIVLRIPVVQGATGHPEVLAAETW